MRSHLNPPDRLGMNHRANRPCRLYVGAALGSLESAVAARAERLRRTLSEGLQHCPWCLQEKVHPKVLIDDLLRQTQESRTHETGHQTDLFADFNGIPTGVDKTEFYQHDQNWSN